MTYPKTFKIQRQESRRPNFGRFLPIPKKRQESRREDDRAKPIRNMQMYIIRNAGHGDVPGWHKALGLDEQTSCNHQKSNAMPWHNTCLQVGTTYSCMNEWDLVWWGGDHYSSVRRQGQQYRRGHGLQGGSGWERHGATHKDQFFEEWFREMMLKKGPRELEKTVWLILSLRLGSSPHCSFSGPPPEFPSAFYLDSPGDGEAHSGLKGAHQGEQTQGTEEHLIFILRKSFWSEFPSC